MNDVDWNALSVNEKGLKFSECLAKLWKIHCFREGNTRTVITFCCQYADEHGFPIKRSLFEKHSAYVRTALVAYNAVFSDLEDLSQKHHLERIVIDAISNYKIKEW